MWIRRTFEHVDLAVLADKRDGEAVAVRRKPEAPPRMESGGGYSVASCFSTPDLTSIETSR
jgi:hypothetical protein